jgi:hypothetical protein
MNTTTIQLRNPRTIGVCIHGAEARLTPGGWRCAHGQPIPAEPLRPAGHGTGLDGPPCAERVRPQFPDDGDYRVRMCVRCGRITALLDLDGVGWCGGDMPTEYLPAGARLAHELQAVPA